ncbi:pilus assembly protein TadG-related protein [Devosia sp. LjRoot16]|uniref:pilus assembly protein TadG-related protein n=1 Tax=Devosia sp. LjRoot16 TaxID=3342271 RepID=UPI003ECDAF72
MKGFRRFRAEERGNIAVMFALLLPVAMLAGAFAVDEGSLYLERRQAQSVADLAAIAAVTDPSKALDTAFRTFQANGLIGSTLSIDDPSIQVRSSHPVQVVTGHYKAVPELSVAARFSPGGSPPNAVQVTYRKTGTLLLARPWQAPPEISVAALATANPQAAFSVGSRLASLNGGVANALLKSLLGTSATLDVMSYDALLDAKVDLLDFLDALNQQLHLSAATYGDVLKASASRGAIAAALASVLTGTAKTAATTLSTTIADTGTIPLLKLLDIGSLSALSVGSESGYFAGLSALELLNAAAVIAGNGKQIDLAVGATLPGLTSIALSVAIGEPPQHAWYRVGEKGAVARTAQTRLKLTVKMLGGPILLGAGVTLPIYIEVAYAEARIRSLTCPGLGRQAGTAVVEVLPGVARLAIGNLAGASFTDFSAFPVVNQATILSALLLKIKARAAIVIGETSPILLNFSSEDVTQGTIKTATNHTIVGSLSKSLLDELDIDVDVLGIGLSTDAVIEAAVRTLVAPLAPVLDSTIFGVLEVLGVGIGEADVRVYSATCSRPVLVG